MRKRILYIHHGWGIGGAPISLLNLVKNLDSKLYEPIVLCIHNSEAVNLFNENEIKTIIFSKNNSYFKHHEKGKLKVWKLHILIKTIIDWFMIALIHGPKLIREINPHIVHLNSEVILNWAYAANSLKIPVVCHNRDPISYGSFGLRRWIIRYLIVKTVNSVISISNDNAFRLGVDNTTVVYNPIPKFFFEDYDKKVKYNSKRVLFLGGVHKAKGFNIVLDTLKYLDKDINIFVAGYLPKKTLKNRIVYWKFYKALAKHQNFHQLGLLNAKQVHDELKKSAILLFPAVKPHFARPVIEAMAIQTPVVASNLQGMEEIVKNDSTGYLVSPNAKEFADTINNLVNNPILLEHLGFNGLQFVKNEFDLNTGINKVMEIYLNLIKNEKVA